MHLTQDISLVSQVGASFLTENYVFSDALFKIWTYTRQKEESWSEQKFPIVFPIVHFPLLEKEWDFNVYARFN